MNISTSWLREWSDPKVSDIDLAEKLTMAGLEVDKIGPGESSIQYRLESEFLH